MGNGGSEASNARAKKETFQTSRSARYTEDGIAEHFLTAVQNEIRF